MATLALERFGSPRLKLDALDGPPFRSDIVLMRTDTVKLTKPEKLPS